MSEFRPASPADPVSNSLLERLAYLESANEGLKSRLSAGGFGAQMRDLALREQLESARAELSRQQEALEHFCRETLAAGQARDRAQAAAEKSLVACEAAVSERDVLRLSVERLEAEVEVARRGALDADSKRLLVNLEVELESARRGARETENALRVSLRKAETEAAERLRAFSGEFAEREARLLLTLEDDRRRLQEASSELEAARLRAEEAEKALGESERKASEEEAERRRTRAAEAADRENPFLKTIESDRRMLDSLRLELEAAHREAQETARALRESQRQTEADADQRLRELARASAERESVLLKAGENEREVLARRVAEMTVELERTRRAARDSESALRDEARRSLEEAQSESIERLRTQSAEFSEREAVLLKTIEEERLRVEELELERPRRGEQAAQLLRTLTAEFAEREILFLKSVADDRRILEAMEAELDRTRRTARESIRSERESQLQAARTAAAELADRHQEFAKGFAEREALFLKTAAVDRKLLQTMQAELDEERGAAVAAERARSIAATRAADLEKAAGEQAAELEKTAAALRAAEIERAAAAAALHAADVERAAAAALAAQQAQSAETAESGAPAEAEPSSPAPSDFTVPSLEPVLDPGWSRLLRLVRPPVDAAYAHLRRLSATALTAGQKTLLRMGAASIASASDSLSSIELALAEGPAAGPAASVLPALEASLAAWEAAFRGRGVALAREFSASLPHTAHDPKELRILLHHILRNVLEAVPR
ncbi:MAG: hypothetical protein ACHQ49_13760, partial [Elusimicrobiota bacterium]